MKKLFSIPVLLIVTVLAYVFREKLGLTNLFDKFKAIFSKDKTSSATTNSSSQA